MSRRNTKNRLAERFDAILKISDHYLLTPLNDVLLRELVAQRDLVHHDCSEFYEVIRVRQGPSSGFVVYGVNRLANLTPYRRPILPPLRGGVCW